MDIFQAFCNPVNYVLNPIGGKDLMRPKSGFSQVILDSIAILDFQFGQLSMVKPNTKLINPTTELKGNSTELKVYRFQFPIITIVGIQRIRVKSIWNEF